MEHEGSVLSRIHRAAARMMRFGNPLTSFAVTPAEWDELVDLANAEALHGKRDDNSDLTVYTQAGPVTIVKVAP